MISFPLVSIFLVGSCLSRVTAYEPDLTGIPVTVTPVDGTHLSFEYKQSVNIKDYSQLEKVLIDIKGLPGVPGPGHGGHQLPRGGHRPEERGPVQGGSGQATEGC